MPFKRGCDTSRPKWEWTVLLGVVFVALILAVIFPRQWWWLPINLVASGAFIFHPGCWVLAHREQARQQRTRVG